MKEFKDYVAESLNEAIAQEHLKDNIEVRDGRFGLKNIPHENIIGSIVFGKSDLYREMIVDKNYREDVGLAGTIYTARIANSMTKWNSGFVANATLAKFNLKTGMIWLAEDEAEDGSMVWGRPFRFKKMTLNLDTAAGHKWIV